MYKCSNRCGYEHSHRGAMNIHEKIHCKKRILNHIEHVEYEREHGRACKHTWRLLQKSELQLLASRGVYEYEEVCNECHDLRW